MWCYQQYRWQLWKSSRVRCKSMCTQLVPQCFILLFDWFLLTWKKGTRCWKWFTWYLGNHMLKGSWKKLYFFLFLFYFFFGHFVCVDTFSQFIWLLSCHAARYFILGRQQPNHKTHARQKLLQRPVWCLVMAKHQCIVLVCNCPSTTDLYFEIKMVFWSGCIMFDMI